MTPEPAERRLAANFVADVVGYSWLMAANENRAMAGLPA